MSGAGLDLHRWLDARLAALPEDAFDSLDDWPENAEDFDPALPGNFSAALEPLTIGIEYRDAQGEVSERQITLLQMSGTADGPVCLDARCHMRRARRKFRFDRILSARGLPDLPEDASPADLLSALADLSLGAYPIGRPPHETGKAARPRRAAPPAFQAVRGRFRAELRLLGFLSKSDGEMHPAEIDAIDRYARSLCAGIGEDWQDEDSAALSAYLQRLEFSAETERLCLEQLQLGREDLAARFSVAMSEVIEADGRYDPAEVEMVFGWGLKPEDIDFAAPDTGQRPAETPPSATGANRPLLILGTGVAAGLLTAAYLLFR